MRNILKSIITIRKIDQNTVDGTGKNRYLKIFENESELFLVDSLHRSFKIHVAIKFCHFFPKIVHVIQ